MQYDGGLSSELCARKSATSLSFNLFGRFWRSNVPTKWKINVYNSVCTGVLTSGTLALAPTSSYVSSIDSLHHKLLRRIMLGKACSKNEDGIFKAMSNKQVCAASANGVSMALLLRMLRLKWWQQVVKYPMSNVQV